MSFVVTRKDLPEGSILVITDKEVLGKVFVEGKKQLDLSKPFYHGEEKTIEKIKEEIKSTYILHLSGENSVSLGVELGLVDNNRIIWIQNVPHAEVVLEKWS
ncbi:DUF424 domain-containing protein [Candidatus Woesearchaeota archaeon CG_4_10_14_0_2_um_filter_33_13]|nr:MAG: DUF424 domain-containing protein [Candidatus Woesearchaeota archaeon CG_4_10_14_0_2_um_filter_33_13]